MFSSKHKSIDVCLVKAKPNKMGKAKPKMVEAKKVTKHRPEAE